MQQVDLDVLTRTKDFIEANDTESVLALFGVDPAIAEHCTFDHGAVLVFPSSISDIPDALLAVGLVVGPAVPSVVVRGRLARRYGISGLTVQILRAPVGSREIEIFALEGAPDDVVAAEREHEHESHLALAVTAPDQVVLTGLMAALEQGGLVPDGGGYNAHVDCTVLYFRGAGRRLELISAGHHSAVLREHLRREPAHRLLELMTGAWQTKAIAVAASMGIFDRLADRMSTRDIAKAVGADRDSLQRLLRYLASLGVVRSTCCGYTLTPMGALLRTDARYSLHPLALLYGGAFYLSFGALENSVRTGRESFEYVFGMPHFDYFAANPSLGFNRAMAASASIFGQVAEVFDFSSAEHVVDVAGGNGELLKQVLHGAPHLRGTLFERPDVAALAAENLSEFADRCAVVAGDFTGGVPSGGDVYMLSRILHDWDDQQCQAILKRCADSMPRDAQLLIVERLLPEDGSPSLAPAWDVHMLCNVGGRERTVSHYRNMLAEAGFTLTASHDLPLDFSLITSRPR
ncbi:acetylserotonin O-methyltransferase [Kibdelosporangium philippinense]|uniref:Acetylserotonin O-methyltransferase n=1 Tax=Kibdelosporangium philippinense TaxID=211113 RepID=A0ABS8ZGW2_9PSEU|nr:acetylserotonin O-methyltransferase [Kibdelosporangium philippinense]MCE7006283.1 acetylserotonin O-methyltransferase [Kibdelosporangium philippinense]